MPELRQLAAAAATLVAILVPGCTADAGPDDGTSTVTASAVTPSSGHTTRPEPTAARSYDDDIRLALETVVEYWRAEFADRGLEFEDVSEVTAYRGKSGPRCGSIQVPARNAVYCSGGADFIAYDSDWLRESWAEIGDTFIYFVIGHEYGHAVQGRLQLDSPLSVKGELQADCFAGAYLASITEGGRLARDRGDFEDLFRGLGAVADRSGVRWFDTGAHGSALQRRTAFFTGYLTSAGACTTAW